MDEDVDELYAQSLDQLSEMLSADNVTGEAIEIDGGVVLPLLSAGFGFGAGQGGRQEGAGAGGAGAGGGIKPVAVVVVTEDEVRIERLEESSIWAKLTDAASHLARDYQRQTAEQDDEDDPRIP
jgi:uncharacterized spore protein YtfJ